MTTLPVETDVLSTLDEVTATPHKASVIVSKDPVEVKGWRFDLLAGGIDESAEKEGPFEAEAVLDSGMVEVAGHGVW